MPLISMTIYFRNGLYADFGMNVYYLLMAIYGYLVWTGRLHKKNHQEAPLKIRHFPLRFYPALILISAFIWWGIAFFLQEATDSTVPVADAFTTAISIVGTWMLARKYIEQWIAWLLVDAVCVYLYIYKGIYFYSLLYAIYTVIAILGYFKWRRLLRTQEGCVKI